MVTLKKFTKSGKFTKFTFTKSRDYCNQKNSKISYFTFNYIWKVAWFARDVYVWKWDFLIDFQPLWFNMEHGTNGQKGLRKSFVDDKCGLHTKFIFQISKKVVMLNESGKKSSFGKSQTGAWCRASLRNFFLSRC